MGDDDPVLPIPHQRVASTPVPIPPASDAGGADDASSPAAYEAWRPESTYAWGNETADSSPPADEFVGSSAEAAWNVRTPDPSPPEAVDVASTAQPDADQPDAAQPGAGMLRTAAASSAAWDTGWEGAASAPPRGAEPARDESYYEEMDDDGPLQPPVQPWDRRPLMMVLASAAALLVLGAISMVAAASLFARGDDTPAAWRAAAAVQPSPTVAAGAPVGSDTVTLSGVGDVIMGSQPNHIPPHAGVGIFNQVKNDLTGDLVMGNLETPLTADTGRVKCPQTATPDKCYQFYLPPSYANHLRDGGFGLVNLANNHTNDMGPIGVRNTQAALTAVGIKYTGAPNEITYVKIRDITVAVLGFTPIGWGQSLNNITAAKALVHKAATSADIVVVQMQGGAEGADRSHVHPGHEIFVGPGWTEDRGDLIAFSHAVIDAGADVVFGHGPHIMRGMEFYKGRLIAYSLGNFCGYGVLSSAGYLGVGGVLTVTLHRDGAWVGGRLEATQMVQGGLPATDPKKRALAFVDGLSRADFGAAAARISSVDGTIIPPS